MQTPVHHRFGPRDQHILAPGHSCCRLVLTGGCKTLVNEFPAILDFNRRQSQVQQSKTTLPRLDVRWDDFSALTFRIVSRRGTSFDNYLLSPRILALSPVNKDLQPGQDKQ